MKFLITLLLSTLYFGNLVAEISHQNFDNLFNVGKMESYNKEFTLYFKSRNKAILAQNIISIQFIQRILLIIN